MAFARLGNRHDSWVAFCKQYRELLAGTGLPEAVIQSEHLFRDLLRVGSAVSRRIVIALTDLSDEQWAGLERFVAVFFRECESFAPLELFPAFRQEAERRGSNFRA